MGDVYIGIAVIFMNIEAYDAESLRKDVQAKVRILRTTSETESAKM